MNMGIGIVLNIYSHGQDSFYYYVTVIVVIDDNIFVIAASGAVDLPDSLTANASL